MILNKSDIKTQCEPNIDGGIMIYIRHLLSNQMNEYMGNMPCYMTCVKITMAQVWTILSRMSVLPNPAV